MSAVETQGSLSEDKVEQGDVGDMKLVPVGESIRYRKRAQNAERRLEELAGELAEVRFEASRLAEELKVSQKEQDLIRRLASEGARDLEAAVLIAKSRSSRDGEKDVGSIIEQLKHEKRYLFGEEAAATAITRTSPAKEQRGRVCSLERAAKRAAGTNSRADLQEYMRMRRSVI
jgi:hypothetical protein